MPSKDVAVLDDYADWQEGSYRLPEFEIRSPDRYAQPIGFINFDRKHMKAENGRSATERRCQIRTVRLK